MASYFELPPQQNVEASSIQGMPEAERKHLRNASLMSPAITQLLEDLGNDDSDSSSESNSVEEDDDLARPKHHSPDSSRPLRQDSESTTTKPHHKPSALSPSRASPKSAQSGSSSQLKPSSSARTGASSTAKQKPAHMARFHSLRSMLFSAHLEDKMKSATKEDCRREEAIANKWKSQHEQRQMHRPKTPEKDGPESTGLGSRLKRKISRMASKEVPTLQNIGEDDVAVKTFDDTASTASSDAEDEERPANWADGLDDGYDSESISHSDVEDLVRWISRRDPPSDGEARKGGVIRHELVEDSEHESLGHSDVEDLVRWVSRRAEVQTAQNTHTGYSDASTESDSELVQNSTEEEEDADDLVRWISHREGPKAGPVRRNLDRADLDSDIEHHYESDVPELGRWVLRNDATSGESAASSPARDQSIHQDADFLTVRQQRGRPRSRDTVSPTKQPQTHLTHDDVDELVRWVSRNDSQQQDPSARGTDGQTTAQAAAVKQQLGMSIDTGSLSHSDVNDLIEHIRADSSSPQHDLHKSLTDHDSAAAFARPDPNVSKRARRGSLDEEDVNELVSWVSRRN
ncbi:hypothetical protein ACN47E_009443 [Coniothyrium glycines]